jgi:CheY-like chemotaxis protein
MPEGGVLTVETSVAELDEAFVAARPGLSPGRYLAIAVSDTGVGIAPGLIEKVFDPFFTTKPLGQGTGLGLSMVYGFVRQSGGQVRIHSQVGMGTSVKLYLPISEAKAAPTQRRRISAPHGDGERVLIIEDEPAVRMLVREVLEELRYEAVEFADPLAAVPYLASAERIDLMISDVGLPGMNGRQLAETARAHRPELPILFITGYAENAAIRSGFLGANMSMVTKPFSLDELAARVSELISGLP